MSTLQRLLLAFGMIVAIAAAQGVLMSINLAALAEKSELAATKPVESIDNARAAWSHYVDARRYLGIFLEMTKPEDSKAARAEFDVLVKALDGDLERLAAAAMSPAATRDINAVRADVTRWIEKAHILLGAAAATSIPTPFAMAQMESVIRGALDRLIELTLQDAATVRRDIESSIVWVNAVNTLVFIFGFLGEIVTAVLSSLAVTRPIHDGSATSCASSPTATRRSISRLLNAKTRSATPPAPPNPSATA